MKDENLFKYIVCNVKRSPAELLLMGLKFSELSRLSFTGTANILKLINRVCGDIIVPETRYYMDKLWSSENITLHAVCRLCSKYLGIFENSILTATCENCSAKNDVSNPSSECFFCNY